MIAYSSISNISLKNKIFNQSKISKVFIPNRKSILNIKKSINIINIFQESYLMFKNINELKKISQFQYKYIKPTPQISWPKVNKRFGNKLWIKHENHTSIGSFKIRSSLNLIRVKSKAMIFFAVLAIVIMAKD